MTKKEEYLELIRRCQYPISEEVAIMLRKEFMPFIGTLEPKYNTTRNKDITVSAITKRALELYDSNNENDFIVFALFLFYFCYRKAQKVAEIDRFSTVELDTTCDSCIKYYTCGIQKLVICEAFETRFYEPLF